MGTDLALIHKGEIGAVHELNRVLDGYNMAPPPMVDGVNHRRERCRLSGACWPGYQHQAALLLAKGCDASGQAELFKALYFVRYMPENRADTVVVTKDVDSKSGETRDAICKVGLASLFKVGDGLVAHYWQ